MNKPFVENIDTTKHSVENPELMSEQSLCKHQAYTLFKYRTEQESLTDRDNLFMKTCILWQWSGVYRSKYDYNINLTGNIRGMWLGICLNCKTKIHPGNPHYALLLNKPSVIPCPDLILPGSFWDGTRCSKLELDYCTPALTSTAVMDEVVPFASLP